MICMARYITDCCTLLIALATVSCLIGDWCFRTGVKEIKKSCNSIGINIQSLRLPVLHSLTFFVGGSGDRGCDRTVRCR